MRRWGPGVALALALVAPLSTVVFSSSNASASDDPSTFTASVPLQRIHLDGGQDVVADRRSVSVRVEGDRALRDRQTLSVTWTGAHPTGGIVRDANSSLAAIVQEYPVVLLECRGVDSATTGGERLSPKTCWTQTSPERYTGSFATTHPAWRLDREADLADRQQFSGAPDPRPGPCLEQPYAEHWLPLVTAKGSSFGGGPQGCLGIPPEASEVGTLNMPTNTTYAASSADGSGSALFNVRTSESNASLGCSDQVPCALVIVPIEGISCDVQASGLPPAERPDRANAAEARQECQSTGNLDAGSLFQNGDTPAETVTGRLWWSASNWRSRITIPLDFAPPAQACDIVGGKGVDLFGSEPIATATLQWAPVFCLDSARVPFKHVQTGEPQARSLLQVGTIDAGLVSNFDARDFTRPVAAAPIAFTGFSVGFAIDDGSRRDLTELKLTPRLLAKLLTQSYPVLSVLKAGYPALSSNPLNITFDPEFQALNPSAPRGTPNAAAATLLNLSSSSDVVRALTSYVDADPDARRWLDGEPDPWGMQVNPAYKGISLPVDTWESRDTYEPLSYYRPGINDCLAAAPVPYLPLVAAPVSRLSQISLAMQFAIGQSQLNCVLPSVIPGDTAGAKLVAVGRQTPGFRFMLGVMSTGDADRYSVHQAALQTTSSPGAERKFTDVTGRTFVAPSGASLAAGVRLLTKDDDALTWTVDLSKLAKSPEAYPGVLLVDAAVAVSGLDQAKAAGYADFIRYAVSGGQRQGAGIGELPEGFVPLTPQNGLASLSEYAVRVAAAVAAQAGVVPPLTPAVVQEPSAATTSPPTAATPEADNPLTVFSHSAAATSVSTDLAGVLQPPAATASADGQQAPAVQVAPADPAVLVPVGLTAAISAGIVSALLPLLLVGGAAALIAGVLAVRTSSAEVTA